VHSADAPKVEPLRTSSTPNKSLTVTESADGKEVYTTASTARSQPTQRPAVAPVASPVPTKQIEEEEDLQAFVPQGAPCKRAGCKVNFASNEENRVGDGPGTKCVYHPGAVGMIVFFICLIALMPVLPQPIFHEGSKVTFVFFFLWTSALMKP
jgi:hypothetical protein